MLQTSLPPAAKHVVVGLALELALTGQLSDGGADVGAVRRIGVDKGVDLRQIDQAVGVS